MHRIFHKNQRLYRPSMLFRTTIKSKERRKSFLPNTDKFYIKTLLNEKHKVLSLYLHVMIIRIHIKISMRGATGGSLQK